jgi:hypothetical protein
VIGPKHDLREQLHALSDADRAKLKQAMDAPMTDLEAVVVTADMVTLVGQVMKVATIAQQKALLPKLIRAGNAVSHIAERLGVSK